MARQTSKAQLVEDILRERRRLETNLAVLSDEEMLQPGVTGSWSVKDILAHLAAWEGLFLDWYRSGVQGESAERAPVGMSRRAIDALNREIYENNRDRPLAEIKAEFAASYQQILVEIEAIPEGDLFAHGRYTWTGDLALVDYVAGNTCNHYSWANAQIRKWREYTRADSRT